MSLDIPPTISDLNNCCHVPEMSGFPYVAAQPK